MLKLDITSRCIAKHHWYISKRIRLWSRYSTDRRDLEVGKQLNSIEYRSKNKRRENIHKEYNKWYFTVLYYIITVIRVNLCNKKFCNHKIHLLHIIIS